MKTIFRSLSIFLFLLILAACGAEEPAAEQPAAEQPAATEASAAAAETPAAPTGQEPTVITGSGDIAPTLDQFRQTLGGGNNGGAPGQNAAGFREINWDGVPDEFAAPNFLPGDFFNAPEDPRARGAFFSTPGEGVQVSAKAGNSTGTAVRFGHLNPTYSDIFKTFSEERLFSPVGSNIVDLTFFVPGTNTPALVNGFGAVYTDVDTEHTAFEYFDVNGRSLGQFGTPIADQGLSFLGVVFPEPIVAKVQIKYGTDTLGPDDGGEVDVAVMDDFIYGEPQPIPGAVAAPAPTAEPAAAAPAPAPVELLLQFQNAEAGPLSEVSLDLTALEPAPEGKTYAVWLVDEAGQYTLLGAAAAGQTFTYSDPEARNLVGLYSGAALSLEAPANVSAGGLAAPTDLVTSGAIPAGIVGLVRHLAVSAPDTPDGKGYDPGLNEQAELAATHSQLALDGIAGGDHTVAKIHLEHVNNILVGSESADFGDLTGDGDPQNPGDGYGVQHYAFQVGVTAGTIAEPSMPDYIREAAAGIVLCAANISDTWGPEAAALVRDGIEAADAAAAEGPGLQLKEVTGAIAGGVDADGSGEIDIAKDECGAAQIYQLSHQLFDIPMTVAGAAQPAAAIVPVPAGNGGPTPVTISMLDFEFDAAQVTVPAGTTVTWTNDGAVPHSATAVDGSFDTGLYDARQSESITFDTPGSYTYYCLLHGTPDGTGGMVGTIVVE